MSWELFKNKGRVRTTTKTALITKDGKLMLSRGLYEVLGAPQTVALVYCLGQRVFGIREVTEGETGHKVTKTKSGGSISIRGLMSYLRVELPCSVKVQDPPIENNITVFDLGGLT